MKEMIKRMCCLLLVFCLLLTALPFPAHAEEEPQVDFVLVLDCSGSMSRTDRTGLAADACKKFMDLMPIENARIAVIAYGYSGKGYSYTHFDVKYDANLIQVLSALEGEMSAEESSALKNSITAATKKENGSKPTSAIGQALAAGVDMLLKSGATNDNACIILLSDGDATSAVASGEAKSLAESVPHTAKKHGWPIYCIELDYGGRNESSSGKGKENRQRLTNICVNSGAGADARMKVSDPADVTEALLKIFDRFMDIGEGGLSEVIALGDDGVASLEFEVPELASETNVIISGSAVEYVELITPKGVSRKITESSVEGDWITNTEKGSYISVKVLRPEVGKWTVKAYGDPKASIHAYNSSMRELGLELIGSPASGTKVTKNDKISLQAYFTYGGGTLNNSGFYAENPANVIITSYDADKNVKGVKEYAMKGDPNGYHFELPVSEIPSGTFNVKVQLKHDMFRSGEKFSNLLIYTSENLPLEHDETQNIDRSGYVNEKLEVIDLTKVFPNPDGDPIEYVIECVNDRNVVFETVIDEKDYLIINTGTNAGTHQMQIKATDPDMTEPLVHDFTIEVKDTPIEVREIPAQEIWIDAYGFQNTRSMTLDLNLNDYYSDPDGVPLVYGEITADAEGIVTFSCEDGMLHADPVEVGEVVISTTVSDGVSIIDVQIPVAVVSGKDIFWRDNWIWFAIAAAIILIIIIIVIALFKNILVKGTWTITMTNENGESCSCSDVNIPVLTSCGKKRKFPLVKLLAELSNYMQGSSDPVKEYLDYFTGAAAKIELQGVLSGKGCSVKNVPSDANVSVMVNGLERKNAQISSGRLTFMLKNPMNPSGTMTIDMDLF